MNPSDLLFKEEPLCEELKQHLDLHPSLGQVLKHPLVFQVPHFDGMNALCNFQLELKKKAVQKALDEKKWSRYIYLHERPYRLEAFLEVFGNMKPSEFWEALSDLWRDTENAWQNLEVWKELFMWPLKYKKSIMTVEERKALAALPERVTIYRGCNQQNLEGIAWTLNEEVAEKFAKRCRSGMVVNREIHRDAIIALFLRRSEEEVIVF